MSSVVAVVKSIVGQVIAVSPEGIQRVLIEGDRLFVGEQVLTGLAGAVTLELADGRTLDLGRDMQWSADAPDSTTDLAEATAQQAPSVDELQQAIAAGADPTTELEATAAGPAAAGGGGGAVGGGHSFVMLDETAASVDPTIGFPTAGLAFQTASVQQEQGPLVLNTAADATTPLRAADLTLTATPTITEAGGVLTYTATLTQAPLTDLTITLSNGQVIVISAGQLTGSVNVEIPPNDTVYIDASEISATITGTSGGGGLVVTPSTTPAVTQITDTIDTTTVAVTADAAKEGDTNVTFNFQLSNPPQGATTLTVNVGGTDYTVNVDASGKGTLVVPNTNGEDVYTDASNLTATVTAVNGGNYEATDLSSATGTAEVKDTLDATTVAVTADAAKEGDANVTFNFQLSNLPQGATTLTVNVGGTEYTVNVDASGKGTLVVPNTNGEDVYTDASSLTATVTAVNGGNYEATDLSGATGTAEVQDTVDTTTVAVTADPAKEGDTNVTFNFQLSNPPQGATTLTVNVGGTEYTVNVDASGKGTLSVPNTNVEDVYTDASNLTATVTAVNGGNYEATDLSSATGTATIADTIQTTTVAVTADPAKEGDANVTFNFQLSNPPQGTTTLTVNVGGTDYTVNVDASGKGTLVVPNTNVDDVYNASDLTATVTAVNGGNYEATDLSGATGTAEVQDTVDTTTVAVTADPAKEGDTNVTFNFQLSNPPQGATTLTVNVGGTEYTVNVDASGKGTLSVPNTNVEDVYTDASNLTATVTAVNGGNYEATDLSSATGTATIADTIQTTTVAVTADPAKEGDANVTFNFQLSNPPQGTTTLTVNVGGTDYTVNVDASGKGTLVVPNTNVDDVYNASDLTATVTAVNGGNYEATDLSGATGTAEVQDTVDTTTVAVTADPAKEGDTNVTFNFQLSNPPQGATTLTVNVGGTEYTVNVDASGKGTLSVPNTNVEDVYTDASNLTATVTAVNGGNYEATDLSSATGTATIADTIQTTTVAVTADPAKEGDANVTFNFQLSNPPQGATTLTVNVGGTEYTVNVDASGKGTLSVPNTNVEDVYTDASNLTATVTAVNGGNYEATDLSSATGTATIADTIQTTTVAVTADPAKEGDANVTFNFQLSNPPQGTTTLTVNVGGTDYTVNVDASGKGTLVVPNTNVDDVYNASDLTATVTAVNGGNYEATDLSGATGTAEVQDTVDTTTVAVTADPAKEGDTNVTFNFQLSNPPQGATTLTVNVGGTEYTVNVDASGKGTLSVPNTNVEDVYTDASNLTATVTAVNGGNYEATDLSSATGTATIADTIQTTTVAVTADPAKEGDANVTFNFQLSNLPQGATTLTVNVGGTEYTVNVDASGKGTLVVPNTNGEDVYTDASSLTATVTAVNGGNYEATDLSGATGTAEVQDTVDTTTVAVTADPAKEGDTNVTFNFQLSNPPQGATTLTVNVGGTEYTVNVDASGKGTLSVPNTNVEDVYTDASNLTATVTAVNGGNYEATDLSSATGTATIADTIQTTTVAVTADPAKEGDANVTFNFQLSNPPQGTTTLTVNVGGTDYTVNVDASGKGTLVVPNTNVDDVYNASDLTATVTAVNGGNYEATDLSGATGTAEVQDTVDTTTVAVTADPAKEGDTNVTFNFQLSNPPQGATTLTVNVGGTEYTVNVDASGKGTLSVPNTNVEDVYTDASNLTATVTAVNGGNYEATDLSSATGTATIADTIQTTTVAVTADPAKEGDANVTFNFQLSNPPQGTTTLTVNVGGTDYTVNVDASGKGTLVVPNTNVDDVYNASDLTATVTAVNGGNYEATDLSGATGTAEVQDTVDTTTVAVTADPAKEGDTNVTFNFQLSNPPQGATTLTVNVGGTEYTVNVDASGKGTLSVPNTNVEDVYTDASNLTATVTAVNGGNYEATDLSGATGTAEVQDTVDTTTVAVTADPAKEGDTNVTFNFQLSNPPQGATTLTVNVGGTEYTVNVDASGKGTLSVPNTNVEDVYTDASNLTATVTAVNGGNYEATDLSSATGTATIADTIQTTTVAVTADPAKEGDANVTFNFQLSNPPQGTTTLTVNVGGTDYTVNVDASGKGTLVVPNTNVDDVYNASDLTATVTAVNGGNYEATDLSGATGTAEVQDTVDTTTVAVTADPAKEGDTNVTFNFQLSNPPQGATTLTVNVGGTEYTVNVDASGKGTLSVPNTNVEDVYTDASNLTATVTAVNGGNYEATDLSSATGTATIADTIQTTTVAVTADPAKEGDANVTFNFQLSNPPQGTTTLTVNVGGTDYTVNVDASGKGTLVVPNTNVDDVYNASDLTATVTAVNGGNYEATDLSGATGTAEVQDTVDTTTVAVTADPAKEGDTNVTFNFQLSNPPQGATTLTVNVGGTEYTVNVDASGKGTLSVPNTNVEDVYTDASNLTATVTAVNGGNYEATDLSSATGTATIADTIQTTTVAVTADPAKEGDANVTFNFQLSNPPQGTTTLTVNVGGTDYTVNVDASGKGTLVVPNTNVDDVYNASDLTATVTAVNGGNYEATDLSGATGTAEVQDTVDTTTVAVTADPAKEGDTNVTFNFQLSNPPQGATTLTVNVGGTEYTVNVDASGKGTLSVPNTNVEDVYTDASNLTATVTAVNGGNYEATDLSSATGTATIADTIQTTTVAVTADPAKEGDANVTFNFQLSNPPQGTTTLTVNVGGTDYTVNVDASGKGTLVVPNTNVDDVYNASDLTATVTAVNGGNYEATDLSGATGTAEVQDTVDTTTVAVTADPAKEGDTNVTFNFQLSNPPQGATTLTVNVGGTEYTVNVDASGKGTLSVPNTNVEDVYTDASNLTATVTAVNGGNYEATDLSSATGTATIADTIQTTTVAVTADPAKEGDANVTFNFQLSNPPQGTTTLTVNVGGTDYTVNVDASGKGTLVVPNTNVDDVYNASDLTATVTAVNGGNYEATDLSGATGTAEVQDTVDTTTVAVTADPAKEGDTNVTFNFQLSNPPQGATTLTVNVGGTEYTVNVDASGKGTLSVPNTNVEDVYTDASNLTATVTAVNGGNYEATDLSSATGTATIADTIQTTTVAVTADPAKEGDANITFNFQLSNPPQGTTTLTVNVGGTDYTVNVDASGKGTLVVPNTNVDDVYNASDLTATVTAVNGGNYEATDLSGATGTAEVQDTVDTTTVAVTADPAKEGDTNVTFNFQLSNPPQGATTLTVNVGGTEYTVNVDASGKGTLVVPNTNVEDVYTDASNLTATVTAVNGGNYEATDLSSATGTATIADTIQTTTVAVTADPAKEGDANVTFNFQLSNPPQGTTTLTVNVGGTDYTVNVDASGKGTLVVPNTNVEDVYRDASSLSATVTAVNGGNFEGVSLAGASTTATVADTIDTVFAKISLAGTGSVTEGGVLTYKVELVDKDGNAVTVPSGKSVSVSLDWSGTADAGDVNGSLPTSVTIGGGSSSVTFPVQTVDDTRIENSESLTATIKGVTDTNNVFENVAVGSQNTATGTILDNDQGPTVTGDSASILESGTAGGSDVVLVLDRSGSMGPKGNGQNGSDPDGSGPFTSRMEMLKVAVQNLFASGAVHSVFIVSFSSSATFHSSGKDGGWFTNLDDAMAAINKMQATGSTDYNDALKTVINNFTAPPAGGGKLVSIFMSDGVPNDGAAPESSWINFLENKGFSESFAVGFGGLSNSDKNYLEPIAWQPGEKTGTITSGTNDNHVLVVDTTLSALTDALVTSAGGSVASGDVTGNDTGGNAGWAADGWKLVSVEFNNVTYTFSNANDVKTIDLGNVGKVIIKADGTYTFSGKDNFDTPTSLQAVLNVTLKDANGATASSTLTLTVNDRSDPIATDDNVTATLVSKTVAAADTTTTLANFSSGESNQWKFTNIVDQNLTDLSSNTALKASLNNWQSTSINSNISLDAVRDNYYSDLTLTDTNGNAPGDAQALTPTYKTGAVAGETLSFSTSTSYFNKGDTATWTLFKSTDGGNSWSSVQSQSIYSSTGTVTTGALDANTQYRILLDVHDGSGNSSSKLATVIFDDFKVNVPGATTIEWSATPVTGSVQANDLWGASGETSTLSVKVNGTWVDVPAGGTTVTGSYGDLVIKGDGSYTYTPVNNKYNVGHTDQFEYKLTQADGDTDSAHLSITIDATGPGAPVAQAATLSLLGSDDESILFTQSDNHTVSGGYGNDLLVGSSSADTFVWKAGETGHDVVKDFKPAEGDRLDLSDLLQGEKASTIDNYLKITTVDGVSTLQVSSEGKLNDAGNLANADVTIKLDGVNWSNTTINSLISGADPTIKIDHSNS
ncbi:type I secretion C-terminal target domain-containing protein [Pseudomonas defluvii]|nr:type I secretion C-terminal target domain-containing protein [Pseudomonas defluvii]